MSQKLANTINKIATSGKGILAADESISTIEKRFSSINIPNTEENRRQYRNILCSTENLGEYISGIILFEETLYQKSDNNILFIDLLDKQKITIGIKVDGGLAPLPNFENEKISLGLDTLTKRLKKYKEQNTEFAKWRNIFNISSTCPSLAAIKFNARSLAIYAAICQEEDIVPIVEPEVLMDGVHTIDKCAEITEIVLKEVFNALLEHKVKLEYIILKPNMVIPGKECKEQSSPNNIATSTINIFKRTVPSAVPSINFLSGGQSPLEATINLQMMNVFKNLPWSLSFSYGRALQDPCIKTWAGQAKNINDAKKALLKRAKLNSLATLGKYDPNMENY